MRKLNTYCLELLNCSSWKNLTTNLVWIERNSSWCCSKCRNILASL